VLIQTAARELVTDPNGRVTGVECLSLRDAPAGPAWPTVSCTAGRSSRTLRAAPQPTCALAPMSAVCPWPTAHRSLPGAAPRSEIG
jgi:hypothetical protein